MHQPEELLLAGERIVRLERALNRQNAELRDATQASDEAERRFLAPLSESAAKQLKGSLRKVIQKDP